MPFADLFNHLSGAEHVHFTGEGESDRESGQEEEEEEEEKSIRCGDRRKGKGGERRRSGIAGGGIDDLFMELVRPVKRGEEIFNTYGQLGSAALLAR